MKEVLNQWVVDNLNARNMSMRELGRRIEADHGYISKVLSGKQEAKIDFYFRIAVAFDAVLEMLRVAGLVPEPDTEELTLQELLEISRQLSPEERLEVLEYALYRKQKSQHKGDEPPPDTEPD